MGKVYAYLYKGKKVSVFHVLSTLGECEHRKAIYFVSGNPLLSLWYHSLWIKTKLL